MKALKADFFMRDSSCVAEDLLGCYLVRTIKGKKLIGQIVETEAYLGIKDPCCHSFKGRRTKRTESMYLSGGYSYVYFVYGMYYCFNVVTGGGDDPSAVLIRAIQPLKGLSQMRINRNKKRLLDLCSGPSKLCQALSINKLLDKKPLTKAGEIYITKAHSIGPVETDSRVGLPLNKDSAYWFLRFYVKNNPFVSVPKNQIE